MGLKQPLNRAQNDLVLGLLYDIYCKISTSSKINHTLYDKFMASWARYQMKWLTSLDNVFSPKRREFIILCSHYDLFYSKCLCQLSILYNTLTTRFFVHNNYSYCHWIVLFSCIYVTVHVSKQRRKFFKLSFENTDDWHMHVIE